MFVVPTTLHEREARLVVRAALVEGTQAMTSFDRIPTTEAGSTRDLIHLGVRNSAGWNEGFKRILRGCGFA